MDRGVTCPASLPCGVHSVVKPCGAYEHIRPERGPFVCVGGMVCMIAGDSYRYTRADAQQGRDTAYKKPMRHARQTIMDLDTLRQTKRRCAFSGNVLFRRC